MKLPPINSLDTLATFPRDTNDLPRDVPVARKRSAVEQETVRAKPESTTRPSRLLHHLAQMRRSDSSDGGNWSDAATLPPGQATTLGRIDRCLTGAHAVTTLLHAAECGRSHEDGGSELGDDLSIGLLFAARELVSHARESLSHFHARCAVESKPPAT